MTDAYFERLKMLADVKDTDVIPDDFGQYQLIAQRIMAKANANIFSTRGFIKVKDGYQYAIPKIKNVIEVLELILFGDISNPIKSFIPNIIDLNFIISSTMHRVSESWDGSYRIHEFWGEDRINDHAKHLLDKNFTTGFFGDRSGDYVKALRSLSGKNYFQRNGVVSIKNGIMQDLQKAVDDLLLVDEVFLPCKNISYVRVQLSNHFRDQKLSIRSKVGGVVISKRKPSIMEVVDKAAEQVYENGFAEIEGYGVNQIRVAFSTYYKSEFSCFSKEGGKIRVVLAGDETKKQKIDEATQLAEIDGICMLEGFRLPDRAYVRSYLSRKERVVDDGKVKTLELLSYHFRCITSGVNLYIKRGSLKKVKDEIYAAIEQMEDGKTAVRLKVGMVDDAKEYESILRRDGYWMRYRIKSTGSDLFLVPYVKPPRKPKGKKVNLNNNINKEENE